MVIRIASRPCDASSSLVVTSTVPCSRLSCLTFPVCSKQVNEYLRLRLMRLAKKVRGTIKASDSFRGKLVKTMGGRRRHVVEHHVSIGERRISRSLYGLHQNPKWLARNGTHEGRCIRQKKVIKINVKEE
ncbi:hypothetical protein Tco_1105633 [Tanacetum coccineum]